MIMLARREVDNPIIHVDRHKPLPSLPTVKRFLNPELQNSGPAEYDVTDLDMWEHPEQGNIALDLNGHMIYEYLEQSNQLSVCLGLRDFIEIHKRGLTFFDQSFDNTASITAWRSVTEDTDGLFVPVLFVTDKNLVRGWQALDFSWLPRQYGLLFPG